MREKPAGEGSDRGEARGWWRNIRRCWTFVARLKRGTPRRLWLAETLALGDRRFVALLELDGARFLLGGTASSLVLLARLDGRNPSPSAAPRSESEGRTGGMGESA